MVDSLLYIQTCQHGRQAQIALLKIGHRRHNLLIGRVAASLLQLNRQIGQLLGVGGIVTHHILHQRGQFLHRRVLAGGVAMGTAAATVMAVVMVMTLAVEMVMLMGVGMVVAVGMTMLVGMSLPIVGMLVRMGMAVLMVVSAAKLIVMNMHLHRSFAFFYIII